MEVYCLSHKNTMCFSSVDVYEILLVGHDSMIVNCFYGQCKNRTTTRKSSVSCMLNLAQKPRVSVGNVREVCGNAV